ncbi:hypothetical protein UR09_00615 [Candidatus Nitromaritima sp. SCGC AAA799-A02]|nr:hypothetical protein UR09_00615 [Candidatus Nitromaritima sp. SCGC AAA799-A02]
MSDEELMEEQDPERDAREVKPDPDEEDLHTEWLGEEEWDDEEDDELVVEEEVPTFIDNGNGTVSDTRNQLMWTKFDSYAEFKYGINWFEAQDYCESLNEKEHAGFDDWRLCSTEEAKTLFSFTKTNFDKDEAEIHIDSAFEPGGGHNTWTYEEKPDYHQYAEKFSYVTGNEIWENKDNEYSHVRLVRDTSEREDWEPEWRKDSKKFQR